MDNPRRALISPLIDYVKRLKFPWLLAITLAVFAIDLLTIDPIPFIDEIALGLTAAVLASLKRTRPSKTVNQSEPEVCGRLPHPSNPQPSRHKTH